jgi:hypothetical protein
MLSTLITTRLKLPLPRNANIIIDDIAIATPVAE